MSVTVGDFNINGLDIFLTSLTTGKYLTGNITYSFNSGAILPRIVNVNDQTISNNAVDFLAEHTNQVTVKNISENEALVDNIKAGIEMITRFAGVNISESSDPSTSYIYITETDLVYEYDPIWNNTKGSGNYPLTPNNGAIVTFSTDNTQYDTNPTASAVSFTEWAILHEMLHTLGLYHPQESFSGKGSVPESLQDIRFSVMNYYNGFDHYENHADYGWAITPMPMDIAVLQKLYGEVANNTGNTTYYWDLITRDLQGNDDSVRMGRGLYAIWDTSGDDTIDFSNNSGRALINLNGATLNSTTVPNEVADMRTALQQSTGWSTLLNYAKEEILSDAAAYGGYLSSVMLTSGFGNGGFVIANQSASSQYDSGVENAIGSSFDDLLIGNAKQNTLNGGAGNDLIYGGSNNDTLIGGAGTDELLGGEGDDLLVGGTGSDILNGGRDSDTADYSSNRNGNSGMITGIKVDLTLASNQVTNDGFGNTDTLIGIERIIGTSMTDMFTGGSMAFEFFGHGGADTFIAGTGTEKFDGGADVDTVNYSGSSSGVTAYLDGTVGSGGAAQGDVLVGIEQLTGSQWNDKLYGDGNNNILHGGNGNDYLTGMLGDDFVFGDDGDDEVRGHSGNDVLFGGTGNDLLDGGEGYDELHGGAGNDRLVAFSGGDLMWGDQGNDVFVFHNYSNWTGATVMDFEFGDKIELSASSLGGKSVSNFINTKLIDTSGGTIIDLQYYDVFVAGVTHTDFTSSSFLFV